MIRESEDLPSGWGNAKAAWNGCCPEGQDEEAGCSPWTLSQGPRTFFLLPIIHGTEDDTPVLETTGKEIHDPVRAEEWR